MPRSGRSSAIPRSVALNHSHRPPFAGAGRDLLLSEPFEGAILPQSAWNLANVGHHNRAKAMDLAMNRLLTVTAAVCVLVIPGPVLAQRRTSDNIASQLNQQELAHLSSQAYAPPLTVPQGIAPQAYTLQAYPSDAAYAAYPYQTGPYYTDYTYAYPTYYYSTSYPYYYAPYPYYYNPLITAPLAAAALGWGWYGYPGWHGGWYGGPHPGWGLGWYGGPRPGWRGGWPRGWHGGPPPGMGGPQPGGPAQQNPRGVSFLIGRGVTF